jgi:hypothetical protein
MENNKLGIHKQPVKKLISYPVLGKASPLFENAINKTYKTSLGTTLLTVYGQRHVSAV